MPMPAPIRPRAPDDACARSAAVDSGPSPCSARTRLSALARSPAVSASVPSRSNSTAAAANRRGAERHEAIFDRCGRFELVQARDTERFFRQIDAGDMRAFRRHRFGEDAASASDVENALVAQLTDDAIDPTEAQRIDLVQRSEFAPGVP